MFNRIFCRIIMFLLPKKLIKRKVKVIFNDKMLKIIIKSRGKSPERFRESVEKLINFFQ